MTMCAQSYGGFRCNNSRCVDRDLVCDGVDHCADESDESQHAPSYCLSTDQGQLSGQGHTASEAVTFCTIFRNKTYITD